MLHYSAFILPIHIHLTIHRKKEVGVSNGMEKVVFVQLENLSWNINFAGIISSFSFVNVC